ncbi:DNA-binding response regulator, OmpR family, contains REC and winged-helix (wHTH) domain [Alkalispirochaeta americana]|uniref:DNA-binding response regulator, OmpR family, contains REC and winged-helix (WHTH) domain n=1 Tax=Alkalispirochaeta americana TaxID=159291 RepID=A0A1N6UCY2_9SPIO|nr:response regulator transcription factor [Alkalispirochaeta americana]SIQ63440.1 DNA-binding response regulator, OmpR family, contains REC and winged-helix (wHTH) domain [Alkalispirochaeta americana]
MAHIIIVEDNQNIREAVSQYLQLEGHQVLEFPGVTGVAEAISSRSVDLIILDIMLPDGDGFLLAKRLRAQTSAPLLFLSARDAESDRITGFEIGADDYVVKPFSNKELVLRVQALLRRGGSLPEEQGESGRWTHNGMTLELNRETRIALLEGEPLALTTGEWEIMWYCATRAPRVVSRESILSNCLGHLHNGSERTVDTHLSNLRGKLTDPDWFETVRGYGYRFTGEPR